ncbi:dihydroorotate dehydrogenase [Aerococcus urinae]|uniref:dihydroorotate dehydrogenase n=1 Tax=Aerococcus mictus TaxID=2976810 RepID=UPI0012494AC8|nr:dihydroorotate dehydrogenase [Aerococcus mictus]KAA9233282.1 dihydroorotate dehydrogenase [Aerococcus mictus]
MNNIQVELPGLSLSNPLMPASGSFGYGDFSNCQDLDLSQLGALVIKTTTLEAREGNPDPKMWWNDEYSLNAVGLKNPGIDVVIKEKLPQLKEKYPSLPIIASVGGNTVEDYCQVAQLFDQSGLVNALEINISCPNVKKGGLAFGKDPQFAKELTEKIKSLVDLPVYVKLSPNVDDVVAMAQALEEAGADGLTMINTLLGMGIDIKEKRPVLGNGYGGISGPFLKPLALRMIHQVRQQSQLPIIGVGGVCTADDVIEMFMAGANAVQVGYQHFKNPGICIDLAKELPSRLAELGISSLTDIQVI